MKRNTVIIIGIVLALLVIVGTVASKNSPKSSDKPATTNSSNTAAPAAAPNTVLISNFSFGPAKLTVKKGTTVTWTNQDDAHHDITPTKGADDFKASKLLAKGESHTFTFDQVGEYSYKCSPHPYMKATVTVTE